MPAWSHDYVNFLQVRENPLNVYLVSVDESQIYTELNYILRDIFSEEEFLQCRARPREEIVRIETTQPYLEWEIFERGERRTLRTPQRQELRYKLKVDSQLLRFQYEEWRDVNRELLGNLLDPLEFSRSQAEIVENNSLEDEFFAREGLT